MYRLTKLLFLFHFIVCFTISVSSQVKSADAITKQVSAYKADARGPYKDIRWFCVDGTTVPPKERCPEKGGVQRARYKDEVIALAKSNHIFLGQILSKTDYTEFWDDAHDQSRIKQYQLEQFLRAADDGWVNRKAQYYRGAFQIEDEEAWGIAFYSWLLKNPSNLEQQFLLIRQSVADIPHAEESNVALSVRAISKELSDDYPPFMNLRVKIHGQPQASDLEKVKKFQIEHRTKLTKEMDAKLTLLVSEMEKLYRPFKDSDITAMLGRLEKGGKPYQIIEGLSRQYASEADSKGRCEALSSAALDLRKSIAEPLKPSSRLAILDFSIRFERLIIEESSNWVPTTVQGQMNKIICLTKATAAFGYLELWEWEVLSKKLGIAGITSMKLGVASDFLTDARGSVEWGTGMVRATYADVLKLYAEFEPLVLGFIDDRVRSSVLLPLGDEVSRFGDFFARQAGFSNQLLGITNQNAARGLNPGYAMGELVVTNQNPEDIEVQGDKIYVFGRPPSDLKPVAGIATVSEGNLVSHVQLLARNLGIPNAVITPENLNALLPFNGKKVFYAVSNSGTVIIKLAEQMSAAEKALFAVKVRKEDKIEIPVDAIDLRNSSVLNLREVRATHSGNLCGPKAANLGQLKYLYPENVVEGLVIPFAIFREHFDQKMPGKDKSFWQFLNACFTEAESMRAGGESENEIEQFVLGQLAILRDAIKAMPLSDKFRQDLTEQFRTVFGKDLGSVPVFLRSDTNMEDLKDFTGAGLNLTLFNVLSPDKIWQGIKDVWASPYTERSYKWRQKYLLNPENVFPSILIIPTVDVDCSGVLITKGLTQRSVDEVTIAFNRGVGGAVEGQASETWVLNSNNNHLLVSPAREPEYMSVPQNGGVKKLHTTFQNRILSQADLDNLLIMARSIEEKLSAMGIKGPYDVELGLKAGQIWLFQVRPFVENKKAMASEYLKSITPEIQNDKLISLNTKI